MSLLTAARFEWGLDFARFMPLNDDLTMPVASSLPGGAGYLMGGAGPFDYSGVASISAVAAHAKIDNAAVIDATVDLSTAADPSAVTVDEIVTALTGLITGFTFSKDATTGRLKCIPGSGTYWQLYGEFAEIAMFGQGFGAQILKSDTLKSMPESPIAKDDNTTTTTTAKGVDIEVIQDGYTKGGTVTITDTAKDAVLRRLIIGGDYDSTTGDYEAPNQSTVKTSFMMQMFTALYAEGSNKEADVVQYRMRTYRNCKGSMGDEAHEAGFSDSVFTIKATQYKDASQNILSHSFYRDLSVTDYETLDVDNV